MKLFIDSGNIKDIETLAVIGNPGRLAGSCSGVQQRGH